LDPVWGTRLWYLEGVRIHVLFPLTCLVPVLVCSQEIRVQTTLVTVPVIATDARGRHIAGLETENFNLFEDGVTQKIAFFAASEEPIHVALLLDASKSTAPVLGKIKKAAADFLSHLRPRDQAMVVSFGFEVRVLSRLKNDRRQLEEAVRGAEISAYADTRLRDAVFEVMHRGLAAVQGRKAIVLLSDGQDVGSKISESDLLEAAASSDTVVYPVHYQVDPRELMKKLFGISTRTPSGGFKTWRDYEKQGKEFLQRLADNSAGRLFSSEIDDLKDTFGLITQELSHQYSLGFYPDSSKLDGGLRTLRVEVTRPDTIIRARRSYRAFKPELPR
jgi:Ca-activated chloride channel family protein